MRRRALLAALPTALAGCSAVPTGPSTDAYPATPPNVFTTFAWDPDRSALVVEFTRGNRLTPENTALLAVTTVDDPDDRTVWVASADADDPGDPAAEFPLSPGATLAHELPEPARCRLIWTAPDGDRSRAVDYWDPERDPASGER